MHFRRKILLDRVTSGEKPKTSLSRCEHDFGLGRERCARDARAMRFEGNWTVAEEGVSIAGGPRSGHSLIMVGEDFFGNGGCARRP